MYFGKKKPGLTISLYDFHLNVFWFIFYNGESVYISINFKLKLDTQ